MPTGHQELSRAAWQQAVSQPPELSALFPVRADDAMGNAALTAVGYQPATGSGIVSSWLPAGERPGIPPVPPGFWLASREDSPDASHPLVARNGLGVAERLLRCSLYRPELDLCVHAPDGRIAGYGARTGSRGWAATASRSATTSTCTGRPVSGRSHRRPP